MSIFSTVRSWFGGSALAESPGAQNPVPGVSLVPGTVNMGSDRALQLSTVWACVDLRASTIASLPFFAYEQINGQKELARNSRLYSLLHESPNSRMTPLEFWRAILMNHDLRGNGYARIDRAPNGEAVALWPMPADQVTPRVLDSGAMVYEYRIGGDIAVLAAENVLHIKNLGNGTVGLSKLEYMGAATDEAAKAQEQASKTFGSSGKATGVLMVDNVLSPAQRDAIKANFAGMAEGNASRLYVLEASMRYQQLSMSPQDQQLMEARKHSVEEICRFFGVPPVLIGHANVTTWGSGVEQILDGWHKLSIRPLLVSIEQAVRKRVMTPRQRATMSVEFSLDALLRGNPMQRADMHAKLLQNGVITIAEVRQLEGWPKIGGTDGLNVQSNLVPLAMLGKEIASGGDGSVLAQ
jgi:HK97 family phage portal protein